MIKKFPGSVLSFILTCRSIIESLGVYLSNFSARNTIITQDWLTALSGRVLNVENEFGIDDKSGKKSSAQNIRTSSEQLVALIKDFISDLDYAYRTNTTRFSFMMNVYGLDNYGSRPSRQILYAISSKYIGNIDQYTKEMTDAGVNPTLLTDMKTATVNFKNDYIALDSNTTRNITTTDEQIAELNAIYDEILSICRLGRSIFSSDLNIARQFTFSVVQTKHTPPRKTKTATPPAPAASSSTPTETTTPPATDPTPENPVEPPVTH